MQTGPNDLESVPNPAAADEIGPGMPGDMPVAEPPPAPSPKPEGFAVLVRDLLVSAVASILIITFLYQPVRVEGTSMLPRLEDSDRLFINKFVYRISAIERGDVVVFHYPLDPAVSYIKRVIALPGDRVRIDQGTLYVNGQSVDEPYVPEEFRDYKSFKEMTLAPSNYFVLGDHRCVARDSREFGPVKRSLIYGKAVFIYWPTKDAGVVH
jgi:signal peptidase I